MLYNENRNDLLDETQRQEPVENTNVQFGLKIHGCVIYTDFTGTFSGKTYTSRYIYIYTKQEKNYTEE